MNDVMFKISNYFNSVKFRRRLDGARDKKKNAYSNFFRYYNKHDFNIYIDYVSKRLYYE